MNKSVIVIGAGVGGTGVAAQLAKSGFKVTVLEKNDFAGGRCSLIEVGGHRFDQGPSLYLLPNFFEKFFAELDEDINNHLEILKCEPGFLAYFHDGQHLVMSNDLSKLCDELQRVEGKSENTIKNFCDFLQEGFNQYSLLIKFALKKSYDDALDALVFVLKNFNEFLKIKFISSLFSRVSKYFSSEKLRAAFSFQAMYIGLSPFEAAGSYTLIAAQDLLLGIWYPKGGMYQVVNSIKNIAREKYGVRFRYNCNVSKINVNSKNEVTGVTLEDGTKMDADLVVCNADLVYAYNKLLPPTNYAKYLDKNCHYSNSAICFYWCMNKKVDQFAAHNIFIPKDYKKCFQQMFNGSGLPDDLFFYVHVPSRVDLSAAPENKDSVFILVFIGPNTDGKVDYKGWVEKVRKQVIDYIEKRCKINNFESLIENEVINEPKLWSEKFNLWKGSIYGLAHSFSQLVWNRPSSRCKIFKNLYFVGASTNPGSGVPLVLFGATMTSDQIVKDQIKDRNVWIGRQFVSDSLASIFIWFIHSLRKISKIFEIE